MISLFTTLSSFNCILVFLPLSPYITSLNVIIPSPWKNKSALENFSKSKYKTVPPSKESLTANDAAIVEVPTPPAGDTIDIIFKLLLSLMLVPTIC